MKRDAILKKERYKGELKIDGTTARIGLSVFAGSDCRLCFEIDPVETKTYLLAGRNSAKPGQTENSFSLVVRSRRGKVVSSDHMYLIGSGSNGAGYYIQVATNRATVTTPLTKATDRPVLRLWFRSFRSFGNLPIETPLGLLAVHGNTEVATVDDMSGYVALRAPSNDPGVDWCDHADQFLRHMHHGLAFAHGGRLQTPRLDYFRGNVAETTFFAGQGVRPEFAVQNFLDHQGFIQALVDRYTSRGPLPDMLWNALGWMHTSTTVDEVRFLTAMTALETIIENQLSERRGTIIPKKDFQKLKAELSSVVKREMSLPSETQKIFCSSIAGINRKTFAEKIHALFDQYQISRRDFDEQVVVGLVKLRNEIVHRGIAPDNVDIWPKILLVRELVARVLLSEIGYSGRYCCYIDGLHDRVFPGDS